MYTIIIPTYNEQENLRPLVKRIAALRLPNTEVLIVDDNSPDGTGEVAEELARAYAACVGAVHRGRPREREVVPPVYPPPQTRAGTTPRPYSKPDTDRPTPANIRVLHRVRKEGLGAALAAGFRDALAHGAEIVVQMDADGSHDPHEIPVMLDHVMRGADLVVGSRRVVGGRIIGWSIHRRLSSWGATVIGRHLLGFRTRDITSGFRAWRAAALHNALATIDA